MSHKSFRAKFNLYQRERKAKVWTRKAFAHYPKHTNLSINHGGSVTAVICMTASGTGLLIFINDITHDGYSRMNS